MIIINRKSIKAITGVATSFILLTSQGIMMATIRPLNAFEIRRDKIEFEFKETPYEKIIKEAKDIENKRIKEENEKRFKEIELKKKQQELNRNKEEEKLNRGGNVREMEFILTFYTGLASENGGHANISCTGSKLTEGIVASNVHKIGTKIHLTGYGEVTVGDTGGNEFCNSNRLDVFVARGKKNGRWESDYEYRKRVQNMGRVKVKGYIIK